MTKMRFFGLPDGTPFTGTLSQAGQVVPFDVIWGGGAIAQSLAAPTAGQILLDDDAAVTADVATLALGGVPTQAGYVVNHFDYTLDGGATVFELPMGPALDYTRRIRIPTGQASAVQLRIWWRPEANSASDEIGLLPGPWSPVRSVTPSIGTPRLTITPNRVTGTGPAMIKFRADGAGYGGLTPYKDCLYEWNFGDAGSIYDRLDADFPWGLDANTAKGPATAHTFEAGDYTVTCAMRVNGVVVASDIINVAIADPETIFTAARTVVLSEASNFADAPAGAKLVTSASSAKYWLERASGNTARLMIPAGEIVNLGGFQPRGFTNIQICKLGLGADPILNGTVWFRDTTGEVAVHGVQIVGPYDPTRPYDMTNFGYVGIKLQSQTQYFTLHDAVLRGHNRCIGPDEGVNFIGLSNTRITDWGSYGFHVGAGGVDGHAFAGVSIKQNPLTERAAGKSETSAPFHADHGPHRVTEPHGDSIMTACDWFSTNDWFADSVQPCVRFDVNGTIIDPNTRFIMDRTRTEGGGITFGLVGDNSAEAGGFIKQRFPAPHEVIIDKWYHTPTTGPDIVCHTARGGTVIRNAVISQPNVGSEKIDSVAVTTKWFHAAVNLPMQRNMQQPVETYNCTVVDMRTAENADNRDTKLFSEATDAAKNFDTRRMGNMLHYAPNAPTPKTAAGAVDLTQVWTPSYGGSIRDGGGAGLAIVRPEFATTAAGIVPYPTAAPAVAAGELMAQDDFLGRIRPTDGSASRGALEPA